MQGGPRGIGDGDAGAVQFAADARAESSVSRRRRSTRESWTPRDIRPSVRSSSAYSAGFDGIGQKAPSQRQARQVSGLGGEAFIQQTVKQSQLDGRGQIVQVETTAEAGATQAQIDSAFSPDFSRLALRCRAEAQQTSSRTVRPRSTGVQRPARALAAVGCGR